MRLVFLLSLAMPVVAAEPYPTVQLRNAHLSMTVMTPDSSKGFYRGSRFDWSGIIQDVQYNRYTIFKPWKAKHDPANHDDITGPCEEFRTPLGYDDAKEGETFLKIGVGSLVKPKEKEYRFSLNYAIKYPGLWEIARGDDDITFKQGMLANNGYGYKYTKTLDILDDTAGFKIVHELTNAGTKDISTEWYNHNFFNVNGESINANYAIYFPFLVKVAKSKNQFETMTSVKEKTIMLSPIESGSIFAELEGFEKNAAHHGFAISQTASRLTMTVKGDEPMSKFYIWGVSTAICPEPYIKIELKPGETKTWTIAYKFTLGRRQGFVW